MSENAKNQLLELLKDLGCVEDCASFQSVFVLNAHCSTVSVTFPDGRTVQGTGAGKRKSDADIAAAQSALDQVRNIHPDLLVAWDEIFVEAQAGDALIKLSVYLSADLKNSEQKSRCLQNLESDFHLATIFEQWKTQGHTDLAVWGDNLGEKRKATFVEALLWRRFGAKVITDNAQTQLQSLLNILQ